MTEPAGRALRAAKPTGALGKQRQEATKDKTDPSAQILDQTEWVRQDSPSSAANPTFGLPPSTKTKQNKTFMFLFYIPFYTSIQFCIRVVFIIGQSLFLQARARAHTHTYTL